VIEFPSLDVNIRTLGAAAHTLGRVQEDYLLLVVYTIGGHFMHPDPRVDQSASILNTHYIAV
jgi:hypothetical protein